MSEEHLEQVRQALIQESKPQKIDGAECSFCGKRNRLFSMKLVVFAHGTEKQQLSGFVATSASHGMIRGGLPVCDHCAPACKACGMAIPTRWTGKMISQIRQKFPDHMIDMGAGYCRHFHFVYSLIGLFKTASAPTILTASYQPPLDHPVGAGHEHPAEKDTSKISSPSRLTEAGNQPSQNVVSCFFYTQRELAAYFRGALVDSSPSTARQFLSSNDDYVELMAAKTTFMLMMLCITTSKIQLYINKLEQDTRTVALHGFTKQLEISMSVRFGNEREYSGIEIDEIAVAELVECEMIVKSTIGRLNSSTNYPFDPIFEKINKDMCFTSDTPENRANVLEIKCRQVMAIIAQQLGIK